MEYVPLIALCVSTLLSIAAIIISALSLRSSRQAQRHTQIVSFEQRKQEVRQIFYEQQLLREEIKGMLNRSETLLLTAKVTGEKYIEVMKMHRELSTRVANSQESSQRHVKNLDTVLPDPSTERRVLLEQLAGIANELKVSSQSLLKDTQKILTFSENIARVSAK